jgi:hypothetical protein
MQIALPPAQLPGPDQVDIRPIFLIIANGKYHEAVQVIKEKIADASFHRKDLSALL